jgi:glycosyltransferase involved in cell wall biosynthesis
MEAATRSSIAVSVVCPFYNEEQIIEEATTRLLERMRALDRTWELILVNDGSRDGSAAVVERLCRDEPRLRLISYPINRGRGHALRTGIRAARGDVIVTTEADLSWGEDIVERLAQAMDEHPEADIVIASPNIPGGGYRNVPAKRVMVSRLGNWIVRACVTPSVTMNTGMTRAYRRDVIQTIPLEEDGKEFHLEVVLKANALRYRFHEIPCVLEWRDYKQGGQKVKRKSSSRVNRLIVSHTLFSIFANPVRYVWPLSGLAIVLSVAFLIVAIVSKAMGQVAAYTTIVGLSLAIIGLVFFTLGVIAYQGHSIQKEIWSLQRQRLIERQGHERREAEEPRPVASDTNPR